MNHLAHCALSAPHEELLIGNFIGDYIKGDDWKAYPEQIGLGMRVHRSIDSYTDNHSAVRNSIRRLRPFAGRFSGPVADILYDHILYLQWSDWYEMPFEELTDWTYTALDRQSEWMPENLKKRWPLMLEGRFLHNYSHKEGLDWVLQQFNRRIRQVYNPSELSAFFFSKLDDFHEDFRQFFPDLRSELEEKYFLGH